MRTTNVYRSGLMIALVLGLLIGVAGCGGDDGKGGSSGPQDPVVLTREGWTAYEALDWSQAADLFQQAIDAGATSTEAYSGAGWTAFQRGGHNQEARDFWDEGLNDHTGAVYDIHMGLGSLDMLEGDFSGAVDNYTSVIDANPSYRFIHQEGINYEDIYLGLAQAYFNLGEYQNALTNVQVLNPTFTADINTSEGLAELSQEIDRLSSIVGS